MSKCISGLALLSFVCLGSVSVAAQARRAPQIDQEVLFGEGAAASTRAAPGFVGAIVGDELAPARARLSRFANAPFVQPSLATRGAGDAAIFRRISPSVVLIVTKQGMGSGSLIPGPGVILTNWHVVRGLKEVSVVFKPEVEGEQPTREEMQRGRVVRVDEVADLALVMVDFLPTGRVPLNLGTASEISVGADAHAIGHPEGEIWTYTKGIISQFRRDYTWIYADRSQHRADVIQTQTPISPGSSGGPLLSEAGNLIGVTSFGGDGQGLNYAVSIDDVQRFLARPQNRTTQFAPEQASEPAACEPKLVGEGRMERTMGRYETYDTRCSGRVDAVLVVPDNTSEAVRLNFDMNGDREPDGVIEDYDRDGKWDVSFWDEDFDRRFELVGYHPDGDAKPSSYESYANYERRFARR
jgi:S1-C subfamily serine protease